MTGCAGLVVCFSGVWIPRGSALAKCYKEAVVLNAHLSSLFLKRRHAWRKGVRTAKILKPYRAIRPRAVSSAAAAAAV